MRHGALSCATAASRGDRLADENGAGMREMCPALWTWTNDQVINHRRARGVNPPFARSSNASTITRPAAATNSPTWRSMVLAGAGAAEEAERRENGGGGCGMHGALVRRGATVALNGCRRA